MRKLPSEVLVSAAGVAGMEEVGRMMMNGAAVFRLAGVLIATVLAAGGIGRAAPPQLTGRGTIKGHVRLAGKLPGNPIIRMGMDPMCAQMNRGKRTVQETVAATIDGSLANVFIKLQGSFPQAPAASEPVVLDQRGCVYSPRVVGVRTGQMLQVRNSDELLHNVHGQSVKGNGFNISEPKAGMVQQFRLKDEEIMLRVKCDVHSWMTAFVGVVSHPYFAVSGAAGTFEIDNVPGGTHTIQAWHERYGLLSQTVRAKAGTTTTVEFTYDGNEKPGTPGIQEIVVAPGASALQPTESEPMK
jgi:plastocyanin